MNAKEYYRGKKVSYWTNSPMRQFTMKEIVRCDLDAETVFEFGCGRGENLKILKNLGYLTYGLEINPQEVAIANAAKVGGVTCGDERDILKYGHKSMTISFTIGVLDHLPDKDFEIALKNIEYITQKTIFCLETNDKPSDYYYPHDYRKYGFTPIKEFDNENGDKSHYTLWRKDVNG